MVSAWQQRDAKGARVAFPCACVPLMASQGALYQNFQMALPRVCMPLRHCRAPWVIRGLQHDSEEGAEGTRIALPRPRRRRRAPRVARRLPHSTEGAPTALRLHSCALACPWRNPRAPWEPEGYCMAPKERRRRSDCTSARLRAHEGSAGLGWEAPRLPHGTGGTPKALGLHFRAPACP